MKTLLYGIRLKKEVLKLKFYKKYRVQLLQLRKTMKITIKSVNKPCEDRLKLCRQQKQ